MYGDHLDLPLLTPSSPPRRSSDLSATSGFRPATGSRSSRATGRAPTASELTTSGASASAGPVQDRKTSRSSTTTERRWDDDQSQHGTDPPGRDSDARV